MPSSGQQEGVKDPERIFELPKVNNADLLRGGEALQLEHQAVSDTGHWGQRSREDNDLGQAGRPL